MLGMWLPRRSAITRRAAAPADAAPTSDPSMRSAGQAAPAEPPASSPAHASKLNDWILITLRVLAAAACYYLATRVAWVLCFPDSKVSLFFPPHAVLVAVLLLVPSRQWWTYALAAGAAHFVATQQAGWPPLYALQCEAFDLIKAVA